MGGFGFDVAGAALGRAFDVLVEIRDLLRLIAARSGGYDGPWTRTDPLRLSAATANEQPVVTLLAKASDIPRPVLLRIAGVAGGRAELLAGEAKIAVIDYSGAGVVEVRCVVPPGKGLALKNLSGTALNGQFYA